MAHSLRGRLRAGEGPAAAIQRDHEERVGDRRRLERILAEPSVQARAGGTSGGDERRLRGLPAIGPAVSGAVPGTQPLQALMANERGNGQRRP